MNRAQKTKQYLMEQLSIFKSYKDLLNSKDEFFEAVGKFRDTTVSYLRKTKIVNEKDIDRLDMLLTDIDTKKSKGYNGKVYWSAVQTVYDKVISKLNELLLSMDEIDIPFLIRCKDVLHEKSAIVVVSIVAIIFASVITGLAKLFINYFISYFK